MKKVGLTWLQNKLNIHGFRLTHESYIGTKDKTELSSTNSIIRTFKSKYDVNVDNPMFHLEFALKYDDLNLAFMKEVFSSVKHQTIEEYIKANPNRKYSRIIGYLYEFLIDKLIDVEVTTTNYENILDPSKYITGDAVKISKWKVNDNLLGTKEFCPIIRRTAELSELLDWDIEKAVENLKHIYILQVFLKEQAIIFIKRNRNLLVK